MTWHSRRHHPHLDLNRLPDAATRRSGLTRSNCIALPFRLFRPRLPPFFRLLHHFVDATNHVEGTFWQVVILTSNNRLNDEIVSLVEPEHRQNL